MKKTFLSSLLCINLWGQIPLETQSFQWWRYSAVLAILLGLIFTLLHLKKKQRSNPAHNFKITQQQLSKDCKIITLDSPNKTFTIFSNEAGCILLDSQSKDSKED